MLMSAQNVGAATKNTVTSIKSNTTSENILTDSEINDLDEYVEVQNNQYVLNIPSNSNFTEQEIKVQYKNLCKRLWDLGCLSGYFH